MAKQDTEQKPDSAYDAQARALAGGNDSRFSQGSAKGELSETAKVAEGGSKTDKQAGETVGSDWAKSDTPKNTGYNNS